jgi:Domain of unknown function (DUF4838)
MLIRLAGAILSIGAIVQGAQFRNVVVRLGDEADSVQANAARILAERIGQRAGPVVRTEREREAPAGNPPGVLLILLGTASQHTGVAKMMERERALSNPEEFLLKAAAGPGPVVLLAAAADSRGVLYAAGEILRRMDARPDGIEFPVPLDFRTAPAFEIRGTQFGQSAVALEKGKVRRWTLQEKQRKIEDYVLAGLNTIQTGLLPADDPIYKFVHSMGLKTLAHYGPNVGNGPPEWQALESIGRKGYLCPSVPAARQALLAAGDKAFRNAAPVDYIRMAGGDGGGCECDRCRPYGGTFVRLCEDLARIVHRYHPESQIFITNQKFDNEGDQAIFDYLRETPRPWLRAFCYGPGSDAMTWQPGHRQNHRMDLFRYPGFGPFDRYLKEILHQLPPQQDIVFFNELTHWRYSQYGYIGGYPRADKNGDLPPREWNHRIYERRPDAALTQVYDRLTFFAWPRYYHWVFGQTVRYGIGDVTHSSGTQDHFNQWMWQRLLWNPQRGVEDVMAEYTRTWFGPEAAPLMAQAIFQLEENLEDNPRKSLADKEGIDLYYRLVKQAGARMPAVLMRDNWLWREYMQKAALDKHIQLNVREQGALQRRVERRIAAGMKGGEVNAAIDESLRWLAQTAETPQMRRLREEAARLGEESNRLFGVRSEGIFNLDHDFIGLGWLKRQLTRSKAASGEARAELLGMIVDYENPGEGGFYDDAGTLAGAPHITHGYPTDFGQPFARDDRWESNRPSQRTVHYTQDEDQGVTFHYRGLDPNAEYRIRFTFFRPIYLERYADHMNQHSQTIYANQLLLAKDVELPEQTSDFFTFDIPREATRGGELDIRCERAADVARGSRYERELFRNTGGWGTIVSEAWLMKKKPAPAH